MLFRSPVLSDISFNVQQGEFIGIIGPNGAGKSTLIRLLTALMSPSKGKIELLGKELNSFTRVELALQQAYVPQSMELNFPFTVQQVVRMGRFPHQKGFLAEDGQAESTIKSAIQNMDLESLKERSFTQLSGGEQQRTIIASALAQQAELLLLDEPTSALDLRHQQLILNKIKQLVTADNKTSLLVTHDINLAAQFCDRLILLKQGKIIADGSPKDVLNFSLIQEVYGIKVYIDVNPFTDSIYILPYDTD